VLAKEVLILIGREQGASVAALSLIAGLDTSNVSRRCDAARAKLQTDRKLAYAKARLEKLYIANIAESQTLHLSFLSLFDSCLCSPKV
jgi:hypothetical protein